MKTWALWLVALAAVVGLVVYLKKQGVFGIATPPPPVPAPPTGPQFGAGEFTGGNVGGKTVWGDSAVLACQAYSKGQGGRACDLAGRIVDEASQTRLGKEVGLTVATGGLYPQIKYGVTGAKKVGSTVKGWFS